MDRLQTQNNSVKRLDYFFVYYKALPIYRCLHICCKIVIFVHKLAATINKYVLGMSSHTCATIEMYENHNFAN